MLLQTVRQFSVEHHRSHVVSDGRGKFVKYLLFQFSVDSQKFLAALSFKLLILIRSCDFFEPAEEGIAVFLHPEHFLQELPMDLCLPLVRLFLGLDQRDLDPHHFFHVSLVLVVAGIQRRHPIPAVQLVIDLVLKKDQHIVQVIIHFAKDLFADQKVPGGLMIDLSVYFPCKGKGQRCRYTGIALDDVGIVQDRAGLPKIQMAVRGDGAALQKPDLVVLDGKLHILADLRIIAVLDCSRLSGKFLNHGLRKSAFPVPEDLFLQIDHIVHAVFFSGHQLLAQSFHDADQHLIGVVGIGIYREQHPGIIRIHHLLNDHGGGDLPVDQPMLLTVCHDTGRKAGPVTVADRLFHFFLRADVERGLHHARKGLVGSVFIHRTGTHSDLFRSGEFLFHYIPKQLSLRFRKTALSQQVQNLFPGPLMIMFQQILIFRTPFSEKFVKEIRCQTDPPRHGDLRNGIQVPQIIGLSSYLPTGDLFSCPCPDHGIVGVHIVS